MVLQLTVLLTTLTVFAFDAASLLVMQSIQIAGEIVLARKALMLIFVSLVGATLFREFAGPL